MVPTLVFFLCTCQFINQASCIMNYLLVLNSTPLLKDLCRVITPDYANHWKVIGTSLGLPTTFLDTTETANSTNLQWCCNEMLKGWLARNTTATWKDVLGAIDSPTITQGVPSSVAVPQSDPLNGVYNIIVYLFVRQ